MSVEAAARSGQVKHGLVQVGHDAAGVEENLGARVTTPLPAAAAEG